MENKQGKSRLKSGFVSAWTKKFFAWTGKNLPQQDFCSTDIDMVFRNREGKIMLLEMKCKKGELSPSQYVTFQIMHKALKALERELDGKELEVKTVKGGTIKTPVKYEGFNLLQFENDFFDNGKIFWNGKEKEEAEIVDLLSFKK